MLVESINYSKTWIFFCILMLENVRLFEKKLISFTLISFSASQLHSECDSTSLHRGEFKIAQPFSCSTDLPLSVTTDSVVL